MAKTKTEIQTEIDIAAISVISEKVVEGNPTVVGEVVTYQTEYLENAGANTANRRFIGWYTVDEATNGPTAEAYYKSSEILNPVERDAILDYLNDPANFPDHWEPEIIRTDREQKNGLVRMYSKSVGDPADATQSEVVYILLRQAAGTLSHQFITNPELLSF